MNYPANAGGTTGIERRTGWAGGRGFNSRHHADDVAQLTFHPRLSPGPTDKHLGKCRWNYIQDAMPVLLADHGRVSCFIKPLLPRPEITGECQRNYIAPKRDHPRVQLPSCDTPRRKTISAEMGAGPRNCFFTLVARPETSGKCWWNYILNVVVAGSSPASKG